jgi:hypothetical protein
MIQTAITKISTPAIILVDIITMARIITTLPIPITIIILVEMYMDVLVTTHRVMALGMQGRRYRLDASRLKERDLEQLCA